MTTSEFIAWFEGFTRRIRGRPSVKEWNEIVAKLASLEGSSPLKAWFEGLRVKVTGVPNDRVWGEIKRQIDSEGSRAKDKKGRLQGLFESFEAKDAAMRGTPDAKAKKK